MHGCIAFSAGAGKPLRKTLGKIEKRRIRAECWVSFLGYFSLDKQRKVSRLPVREPALKSIRRDSDTIKPNSNKRTLLLTMQIWIDADACPKAIKDILFRAAERCQLTTTLVANQSLPLPPSRYIRMLRVGGGFDVADNEIVQRMSAGDLVVTGDIPLAAQVIAKGGHVIDTRGEAYSRDNIGERLAMRDFMDGLRSSGVDTGGPAALSSRDVQNFANQLDRFLARHAGLS